MNTLKIIKIVILLLFIFVPNSVGKDNDLYDISNELMCPVCQGQTVAESNSGLAISMREVVKKKLDQGQKKEEILQYFVGIYGDTILAKPPTSGFGIILYIIPISFFLFSVLFWIYRFKK